ncbi:hypothetical protein D1164_06950 [Mariniphaga sediminis]|uniref:Lipocalin-like domain-containing protein n=1 Tax=Mariniphaga sediminis TaxID=1628158 RepID=A0A399D348_9BACT|nr:DUF6252 family protein [Mariniphaga sediminis]RIH65997.1 hypothetical protein D1164_06950 [Mariniphaga sediminis]
MKKQSAFLLINLLIFILFAAGSCEKENEEPQLPPITQTGAGTFGCLVNGKVWNSEPLLFGSPLGASNNQWEDRRWIIDAVGKGYTIILEICRDSVIKGESTLKGSFESDEDCSNGIVHFKNYASQTASFQTTYDDFGKIYISRFDTINQIISGTFYFDAVNSSGEKIEIRDGRFDVKFINYEP